MPCTYVSETVPNLNNLKILMKALDKLGHKYQVDQRDNAAVISSRGWSIEMNPEGSSINRGDGDRTWINQVKQRYAAEAAKMVARKKGYFVKETMVGGQIELTVQGGMKIG